MKKALLALALLLFPLSAHALVDDLYLVKGDTLPYYWITVRGTAGPVNLTGATVTMTMVDSAGVTKVSDAAVTVTAPLKGEAEYRWQATDTDTAGTFYVRFKVVTGGRTFSLPSSFSAKVIIRPAY